VTPPSGPRVDATGVEFRLPDPHARLAGVRLYQEVRVPGDQLQFRHRRGGWTLQLARPAVDRLEYLLELEHPNGGRETICDPTNPHRVPGAFGEKSVIEFPGYRRPAWAEAPRIGVQSRELAIASLQLGTTVRGRLLAPDGLTDDRPAPLLVVHDGPEYADLADLAGYAAALIASGDLPPLRLALLEPGDRNRWYAASPAYARALTGDVLPALEDQLDTSVRVGIGASLGALAMLHAHRLAPGRWDGLFLQSGSFFTRELDPQERRFSRFGPVSRFVAELAQAVADPAPVPVALTCGMLEENLANNRAMAVTLAALGYPVRLTEVADVHNYTAWRDALDPALTRLIREVLEGAT
jgi:enterochelin esterase family protein